MSLITPTKLNEQELREFQFLYYKHYNIKITQKEAQEKGVKFLQFMTVIISSNQK